jgi:hypothetical protein
MAAGMASAARISAVVTKRMGVVGLIGVSSPVILADN